MMNRSLKKSSEKNVQKPSERNLQHVLSLLHNLDQTAEAAELQEMFFEVFQFFSSFSLQSKKQQSLSESIQDN